MQALRSVPVLQVREPVQVQEPQAWASEQVQALEQVPEQAQVSASALQALAQVQEKVQVWVLLLLNSLVHHPSDRRLLLQHASKYQSHGQYP